MDRKTVMAVVTFVVVAAAAWFLAGSNDEATAPTTTAPAVSIAAPATTASPAGAPANGSANTPNVSADFDTVTEGELPDEARATLELIEAGGPYPYDEDGDVFQNREGLLPAQAQGYYREFTVATPGSDDRGARRLVTGEEGEIFYTADHYDSFRAVVP